MLFELQQSVKEIPTSFIQVAGLLVIFLSVIFIFFLIISRQRQNHLFLQQQIQKEAFEKQLLQSQVEVQESTYTAMGKELHDNVGQLLSTAKMMIGSVQSQSENPSEVLKTISQTVGQAINEIRTLSKSLSKDWLEQFNLVENLATEVKRINAADKIEVHFNNVDKLGLLANRQIILFRIIQEAVQNAIKHASPNNIYINITTSNPTIIIVVSDDGKGFDTNFKSNGMGTLNMRQRTNLLNGNITWTSTDNGCTVTVNIPLLPEEM